MSTLGSLLEKPCAAAEIAPKQTLAITKLSKKFEIFFIDSQALAAAM
ncbi:MAG: hypothetical protein ACREFE_02445 [Limisphaerales bacterium]